MQSTYLAHWLKQQTLHMGDLDFLGLDLKLLSSLCLYKKSKNTMRITLKDYTAYKCEVFPYVPTVIGRY